MGNGFSSRVYNGRGVTLTTHLNLMPMLRISGACTKTTFLLVTRLIYN
jgi:hypothetical protein